MFSIKSEKLRQKRNTHCDVGLASLGRPLAAAKLKVKLGVGGGFEKWRGRDSYRERVQKHKKMFLEANCLMKKDAR